MSWFDALYDIWLLLYERERDDGRGMEEGRKDEGKYGSGEMEDLEGMGWDGLLR